MSLFGRKRPEDGARRGELITKEKANLPEEVDDRQLTLGEKVQLQSRWWLKRETKRADAATDAIKANERVVTAEANFKRAMNKLKNVENEIKLEDLKLTEQVLKAEGRVRQVERRNSHGDTDDEIAKINKDVELLEAKQRLERLKRGDKPEKKIEKIEKKEEADASRSVRPRRPAAISPSDYSRQRSSIEQDFDSFKRRLYQQLREGAISQEQYDRKIQHEKATVDKLLGDLAHQYRKGRNR